MSDGEEEIARNTRSKARAEAKLNLQREVKLRSNSAGEKETARVQVKNKETQNTMSEDMKQLVTLLSQKFNNELAGKGAETVLPEFDGETDVNKWFENFEANAEVYKWTNLQKFVFATNKMTKLAKLFLHTATVTDYKELKTVLTAEFGVKYSGADIHNQLRSRKKKENESFMEYTIIMRQIGAKKNIDEQSIIRYIVDGIRGRGDQKVGMYSAENYSELKRQYEIFDHVNNNKCQQKLNVDKNKKDHCFNCGSTEHKRSECRSESPKCFKCNKMGHIAKYCGTEAAKKVAVTQKVQRNKNMMKAVMINGVPVLGLVDTGAEISLVKQSVAVKWKVKIEEYKHMIAGIGGRVKPIGIVQVDIVIDAITTRQSFVVVPEKTIVFDVLMGFDIISQFRYISDEDGYTFTNLITDEPDPFIMMNAAVESDIYEVLYKYKDKVDKIVADHKPNKEVLSPISMKINILEDKVIHHMPTRFSPAARDVVIKQVEEWLNNGVIRPSTSEYCSRLVLVGKKDGSKRVCVDFRDLNKIVQKDRFPVPLIEEVIEEIKDAVVFSILDLENAYFHVPIEEESKKFTAFVCKDGLYEFNRAPFGFCNSPAVFLRFISFVFRKLINQSVMQMYMDDIIIYSKSEEEGLEKLKKVLNVAAEFGLKIKWKKCKFLQRKVTYLGFILENGSVQPEESTVAAIRNFPLPKCVKDVQAFLGMSGFFRKFIQNYALITEPLTTLLKKDVTFQMGEKQQAAIDRIKYLLTNKPILKIFSPTADTELHCDASKVGFGAVLMQKFENKWHPVYFWSKKASEADKNRHSYFLEVKAAFLAIKRLKHYLWGKEFVVVTDCDAFKSTVNKAELPQIVDRYIIYLADFRFTTKWRRGTQMKHADALSRYPVVMNVCTEVSIKLKRAQDEDEHIKVIKEILSVKPYEDYKIVGNVLYKQRNGMNLIVIPKRMENEIIRTMHEKGHWAAEKTQQAIEQEYFIPHLRGKVEKIIYNCVKCILHNKKLGKKEGYLHPIEKGDKPLCDIHVDHLGPMDSTSKMYRYILTVVDAFSKFVWIYPTKTTTAEETIRKLKEWTKIFGAPQRIISDKGTAFTANCFKEWCADEQVEQVLVTTGVARGNGQAERINRVILNILAKLSADNPEQWYKYVDKTQRAINSTINNTTKFSPFELMFGVRMKNELDIVLNDFLKHELIDIFAQQRDENRIIAKKQIVAAQAEYKKQFDKKRKDEKQYEVGDLVAIKRTQFIAGKKLASDFLGPYEVTKCKRNGRYEVSKVGDFEGTQITSTSVDNMKPWTDLNWDTDLSDGEPDVESDGRV